jgi:NAD(P)-dependent dehydrogenase (short-subunit alcohol dehydrogenase family)
VTITLITGGNKGLGREAARRLIGLGHTVYLGARDAGRGQAAAARPPRTNSVPGSCRSTSPATRR